MNREQRRALARQVKQYNKQARAAGKPTTTYTEAYGNMIINRLTNGVSDEKDLEFLRQSNYAHMDNTALAPDGTKCKLNIEALNSRNDASMTENFKQWIADHADQEMTITREGAGQSLVCLEEDEHEASSKFLFDVYSDLLIYDNDKNEYLPLAEIEESVEALKESIAKMEEDMKTMNTEEVEEKQEN